MKNISQRDLRKLENKGFSVSEVTKPEVKTEDQFLLVTQKVIDAFKSALNVNVETMAGLVKESQEKNVPVAEKPKKKKFELIPERNNQGYIQKITIREI